MGVYVHLPFCAHKCYYCDFHSVVVADQKQFALICDSYLLALRRESLYYRAQWGEQPLGTIFLGGGTPSLVPAAKLASFLGFLRQVLPFVATPEITIEVNPQSLTELGLRVLSEAGVNRVSLGAQAFQDRLLKKIGRIHRAEQIEQSVRSVRAAGIANINLDLMFGLPGQSLADWAETLERALELAPSHLSCYALIVEPGTPFGAWLEQGKLRLPGDDLQAGMYDLARSTLKKAGYSHYEISNFCRPGSECRHNLLYWQNQPFIGLGSGATGYLSRVRYTNRADLAHYLQSWEPDHPPWAEKTSVNRHQEMDETMMVGMRLLAGVSEAAFFHRYGQSFFEVYNPEIADLLQKGLVEYSSGHLRVTERGLQLENLVSGAFLR